MTKSQAETGYEPADQERFVSEERTGFERRTEFARDRARVLHSSALRRLGAKTQVLEPAGGDFARTRLTHSLEVAQVGREMAAELGVSPDLVDMACLAHDLGHPPFGHNGERALNEWAADIGGFEGNAQTLRLLTRLEPKVFAVDGKSVGLNLTRAALDATCKYPWQAASAVVDSGADRSAKFGVYDDDLAVFEWMRASAVAGQKSIEAQIMDFADDVAYSVHDFEDAIVSGFIELRDVADPASRTDLLSQIKQWAGDTVALSELDEALTRLQASEYWPTSFSGDSKALASLKNLTSEMIGTFVARVTDATISSSKSSNLTRYRSNVIETKEVNAEISVLKGLVSVFLMSHESRRPFYEWQRAILKELADALLARNGKGLDRVCQEAWSIAPDDASKKRVIVDQIALLTDQSALTMHNALVTRGL